jgi:RNA polymerase sigma-70 factor (ECF subfamily)
MDELFHCAQVPLVRFFFRLSRCPAAAEDLAQNTFLRLWNYRGSYRGQGARCYIYRVALNEWRTNYRREQRRSAVIGDYAKSMTDGEEDPPEAALEREEVRQRVRRAVETLPESQRQAFLLHRIEGLSCREIAQILEVPRKTVESRLRLALQKLITKLRAKEGGP